jgi:DNA-binding transcriptional LysR family regulator
MNDSLEALRLFVQVSRTSSFSRAARELGISQPSASRLIAALERDIGASLFHRSTRAVVLTQAGADYLARVEPVLKALDEANEAARDDGTLNGVLRVGLPASIGIREVIPRLPKFLELHPALKIELAMDDRRQDLVREAIDVAIRFGGLDDSSATSLRIGVNARVLVAAPRYLKRSPKLRSPADLAEHKVILGPPSMDASAWVFERDGKTVSVRVEGQLTVNVNEAAVAAAEQGLGIVSTGLWGCRRELVSGSLVQILKDWSISQVPVHAVYTAGRATKQSAKVFVQYLTEELKKDSL